MEPKKRKIKASSLAADVRRGMDVQALADKYGVSSDQVFRFCERLVEHGLLKASEVPPLEILDKDSTSIGEVSTRSEQEDRPTSDGLVSPDPERVRGNRYGGFFARLFGLDKRRARTEYTETMHGLVRRKVQDPYGLGANCALGDVFLESALDGAAVYRVMRSYGIEDVSRVFDPTSNPTVETMMMLGKSRPLIDTFGKAVTDPNGIPSLLPASELSVLRDLLLGSHRSIESLSGHVAERIVRDRLIGMGYEALLPQSSTQAGHDLSVGRNFFEDHGLPFIEDPDTGLGKLQVKNVTQHTSISDHFKTYPEIPVIAPDDIAQRVSDHPVVPFSALSLDRESINASVAESVKSLTEQHFGEAVDVGMETREFADAVQGYGGFGLDLQVPYLGTLVATSVASYRSYKAFTGGQIDLPEAALRVVRTGGASFLTTLTSTAAGSLAVAAFTNDATVSEAIGEGIASAIDIADGGDFELEDVGESLEAVAVELAIHAARWAVKKSIAAVTGWAKKQIYCKYYERLESAQQVFNSTLDEFQREIARARVSVLNACGAGFLAFHRKRLGRITEELGRERSLNSKALLPSARQFFLEYALERQQDILNDVDRSLPSHPLSETNKFFDTFRPIYSDTPVPDTVRSDHLKRVLNFAVFLTNLRKRFGLPSQVIRSADELRSAFESFSGVLKDMREKNLPMPT